MAEEETVDYHYSTEMGVMMSKPEACTGCPMEDIFIVCGREGRKL